jgi:hypothetical protein
MSKNNQKRGRPKKDNENLSLTNNPSSNPQNIQTTKPYYSVSDDNNNNEPQKFNFWGLFDINNE